MKNLVLILMIIFTVGSCNNNKKIEAKDKHNFIWPDSLLTAKIRDTLHSFSFIKKQDHYFNSLSNHKHGVTFTMDTFGNKIYPIAVFYVEEEKRFQKLYRFEVDPLTMEIKIADINSGKFITVGEYFKLAPEDKN